MADSSFAVACATALGLGKNTWRALCPAKAPKVGVARQQSPASDIFHNPLRPRLRRFAKDRRCAKPTSEIWQQPHRLSVSRAPSSENWQSAASDTAEQPTRLKSRKLKLSRCRPPVVLVRRLCGIREGAKLLYLRAFLLDASCASQVLVT